jgi:hypothetical protein
MAKKLESEVQSRVLCRWGEGYIIEQGETSRLEGRLLTLLESLGLPEKQEEAIKSLVRQELWNTVSASGFWITADEHTALREANQGRGQSNPRPL